MRMIMKRRAFLAAAAVLLSVSFAPAQAPSGDYLVLVGSYTHPTLTTTSASKGIYAFRFDSKSGTLSPLGVAAEAVNPAHVWASPNGKYLMPSAGRTRTRWTRSPATRSIRRLESSR